jgi:hypothetical protein
MGSMKRKADKPLDGKKPLKKKSKNGLSTELPGAASWSASY